MHRCVERVQSNKKRDSAFVDKCGRSMGLHSKQIIHFMLAHNFICFGYLLCMCIIMARPRLLHESHDSMSHRGVNLGAKLCDAIILKLSHCKRKLLTPIFAALTNDAKMHTSRLMYNFLSRSTTNALPHTCFSLRTHIGDKMAGLCPSCVTNC